MVAEIKCDTSEFALSMTIKRGFNKNVNIFLYLSLFLVSVSAMEGSRRCRNAFHPPQQKHGHLSL